MTRTTTLIASMSIAGIPPFNGFWSKVIIIVAAVEAGRYGYASAAVAASVLTLASFAKVMKYAYSGQLKEQWEAVEEVPLPMRWAMGALALVCVTGGALLIPGLREIFVQQASGVLVSGVAYADVFQGIW